MIAPDAALSPAAVCYPPAPTRALPSSRRLVVSALLWMVAAALFFAMSLAITFFALGLFRVAVLHAPASPDNRTAQLIGLALAVFSIYGTFTIVSLHKARQIGNGDWRAGLGFAPIRNALRVLGFAALLLVFVSLLLTTLAVNPTLHALYTSHGKQFGKSLAGGSPAFVLLFWAVAILLAPVAWPAHICPMTRTGRRGIVLSRLAVDGSAKDANADCNLRDHRRSLAGVPSGRRAAATDHADPGRHHPESGAASRRQRARLDRRAFRE